MLISVCMCTYKRDHLFNTLSSLAYLNVPLHAFIEVIVVDNDANLYGQSIVDKLRPNYPHPITYASEPKKNISAARNMCLSKAKGDWIAFIDDDEIADEDWLMQLYLASRCYQAGAVFGRVISTYPEDTPEWIIQGHFFDRKEKSTGDEVSSGACNCTLVSVEAIGDQLFDLSYGLSGGEDADFFHRIHQKGIKLVYCDEAIVSEEVEKNRLSIDFLIHRKIRIGSSFSKYRYENQTVINKAFYIAKSALILSVELLLTAISYPLGKVHFYKWLLRSADRYGKLKYFYQKKLQELY